MFYVLKEINDRDFEVRASGRVPKYLILDSKSYQEVLDSPNAKYFFSPATYTSRATFHGIIVSVLPGTENHDRYVEVL
jgi:hypothetical protein